MGYNMMKNDVTTTKIIIPSEYGYERVASKAVSIIGETVGLTLKQRKGLEVAVIEACINALDHAYQRKKGYQIIVTATVSDSALTVEVVDFGIGRRSFESKKDPLGRGWGLHIIRKVVDEVRIESKPDEGTRVIMTFHRKSSRE